MNTPDQGPRNGDFVAYLEELERHQLQAHRALVAAGVATIGKANVPAGPPKIGSTSHTAPSAASVPTVPASPMPISPAVAAGLRSMPIGLLIVGLVLVVAGSAFNGGIFLVIVGLVMLAQVVRAALQGAAKSNTQTPTATTAAQQVAALLATHVQRNTPGKK